jgi:hypothetical protein
MITCCTAVVWCTISFSFAVCGLFFSSLLALLDGPCARMFDESRSTVLLNVFQQPSVQSWAFRAEFRTPASKLVANPTTCIQRKTTTIYTHFLWKCLRCVNNCCQLLDYERIYVVYYFPCPLTIIWKITFHNRVLFEIVKSNYNFNDNTKASISSINSVTATIARLKLLLVVLFGAAWS